MSRLYFKWVSRIEKGSKKNSNVYKVPSKLFFPKVMKYSGRYYLSYNLLIIFKLLLYRDHGNHSQTVVTVVKINKLKKYYS